MQHFSRTFLCFIFVFLIFSLVSLWHCMLIIHAVFTTDLLVWCIPGLFLYMCIMCVILWTWLCGNLFLAGTVEWWLTVVQHLFSKYSMGPNSKKNPLNFSQHRHLKWNCMYKGACIHKTCWLLQKYLSLNERIVYFDFLENC